MLRGLLVLAIATMIPFALKTGARRQPPAAAPILAESDVPAPVRAILARACQDCHSQNTVWPWYANIPPVSWQIHSDVEKARAFLDLSRWDDYTEPQRQGFVSAIETAVENHLMPPSRYLLLHPEARLSADDMKQIRAWALARTARARR